MEYYSFWDLETNLLHLPIGKGVAGNQAAYAGVSSGMTMYYAIEFWFIYNRECRWHNVYWYCYKIKYYKCH